jgi:hypothetical protein
MRMLILVGVFALCASCAWAQSSTPFVNGVPETVKKSMSGNKLDPLGIWNDSDVELPGVTKGLAGGAGPSVHELSIEVSDGTLVLSQLWDASCSTSECPTQVYLLKKDGTKELKLEATMLPQIVPEDKSTSTKGLSGQPSIFLDPDGKSITAIYPDNSKVQYPLK